MSDEQTREPGQPGDGNAANRVITAAGKGKDRYTIAEAATVLRCDAKWLSNHCGTGEIECVKDKGTTAAGYNGIVRYIPRAEVARLAAETPWEASKPRGAAKRRPAATKEAKRAAKPESAAKKMPAVHKIPESRSLGAWAIDIETPIKTDNPYLQRCKDRLLSALNAVNTLMKLGM